ncbi:hypothetical protein Tco_1509385 [Tanacetum coccineum]
MDLSLKNHDAALKNLEVKIEQSAQAIHAYMTNGWKSVNQVKAVATKNSLIIQHSIYNGPPELTPDIDLPKEPRTLANKVKRRIAEEQRKLFLESLKKFPINIPLVDTLKQTPDYIEFLQELMSNKTKIKEESMVKLNARCSAVFPNELPSKEKDPGSFILPCLISSMAASNALADLGASISVMSFSMFKRLGVGNLKPVKMLVEMADKSVQSLTGMIGNVLVKIDKFIFPVDFFILDIVEDDKVPIILVRPMLAIAHAMIDIFGKKISLEVGSENHRIILTS